MAHLGMIVSKNPREYWILHEIIVGTPSQGVQVHKVVKVADLSPLSHHENKSHKLIHRKVPVISRLSQSTNAQFASDTTVYTTPQLCFVLSRTLFSPKFLLEPPVKLSLLGTQFDKPLATQ